MTTAQVIKKHSDKLNTIKANRAKAEEDGWSEKEISAFDAIIRTLEEILSDLNASEERLKNKPHHRVYPNPLKDTEMTLFKTEFGWNYWTGTKNGEMLYNVTQLHAPTTLFGFRDAEYVCKLRGVPNCFLIPPTPTTT